jgi:hypothetical protein
MLRGPEPGRGGKSPVTGPRGGGGAKKIACAYRQVPALRVLPPAQRCGSCFSSNSIAGSVGPALSLLPQSGSDCSSEKPSPILPPERPIPGRDHPEHTLSIGQVPRNDLLPPQRSRSAVKHPQDVADEGPFAVTVTATRRHRPLPAGLQTPARLGVADTASAGSTRHRGPETRRSAPRRRRPRTVLPIGHPRSKCP